jgi:hypothetical protein
MAAMLPRQVKRQAPSRLHAFSNQQAQLRQYPNSPVALACSNGLPDTL